MDPAAHEVYPSRHTLSLHDALPIWPCRQDARKGRQSTMAKSTGVEWTNSTLPLVQGCDPVSPGCTFCYAILVIHRLANNPNPKISTPLQGLVEKHKGRLRWTGKIALREDRLSHPFEIGRASCRERVGTYV